MNSSFLHERTVQTVKSEHGRQWSLSYIPDLNSSNQRTTNDTFVFKLKKKVHACLGIVRLVRNSNMLGYAMLCCSAPHRVLHYSISALLHFILPYCTAYYCIMLVNLCCYSLPYCPVQRLGMLGYCVPCHAKPRHIIGVELKFLVH